MSADLEARLQELASAAQETAEAHLEALLNEMDDEGETTAPSFGPFCSCVTCIVREVLMAAAPILEELFALTHKAATTPAWNLDEKNFPMGTEA